MNEVPNSVLWLTRYHKIDGSSAADSVGGYPVEETLKAAAEQGGLAPDRLLFTPFFPYHVHLQAKSACHLWLDTQWFDLHTIAAEMMWAGVPGITRPHIRIGRYVPRPNPSRVAASILNASGLPDLITESAEEYKAVSLVSLSRSWQWSWPGTVPSTKGCGSAW